MSHITRRSYTDEFKHQAVALAESLDPAAAARQLEMSVKTLANWVDATLFGWPVVDVGGPQAGHRSGKRDQPPSGRERQPADGARNPKRSGGAHCQRVQVRYAFVPSDRTQYLTRLLYRVLGVSVSGLHDYLHRLSARTADADAVLRAEFRAIHKASKHSYGRHRLVRALRARNHQIGHKRVARLMAEERIQGRTKGHFWHRTSTGGSTQLAPNLLDQ